MKLIYFFTGLLLIVACNNKEKKEEITEEPYKRDTVVVENNYFPVTNYLRGQLIEIKENGITPVRVNGNDSSWIKVEELARELDKFLHPAIDSSSMIPYFKETKYMDQTINAYSFTYEPKGNLPDSIPFRNWSVYVNPATNKVMRVYIEIYKEDIRTQLNWESDKWCSIRTIREPKEGESTILKYEVFNWSYL